MAHKVRVAIHVDAPGVVLAQAVTTEGYETNAVLVNRALELATKKIQAMVQAGQVVQ